MDVSIIIVNYNTLKMTQACIDSVFDKTTGVEFEVILVDNGSTDGSKELFENDSRITYIYSKENLGFGRANNMGYEKAKGNYLFLLNSDTYLVNNAIYMLWEKLECFRKNKTTQNIACVGTMLLDNNGKTIHSYARFPRMWQLLLGASAYPVLWKLHILKEFPNTSNYGYEKGSKEWFDVEYITGADLMVRKNVADKFGLFDSDFFMYSEETEMQYRYTKAGLRSVICEGPKIVHLEGMSNRNYSPQRTTMVMRSYFLFFRKTSPATYYHLFRPVYKLLYIGTILLTFPFVHGRPDEKLWHILEVLKMR